MILKIVQPGARASTRAAMAVPSFQSLVKLVMFFSGNLVLDPSEEPLLRSQIFIASAVVILPGRHRDGIVKNETPDETHDQLQLLIYYVRAIYN